MLAEGAGMNIGRITAWVAVGLMTAAVAPGKDKKAEVPAAFEHAQYIFVESMQGDAYRPGVFPDDRQAIYDVEDALRDWNRYKLAMHREEADIVLVVRRGRLAGAQAGVGVSVPRPQSGPYPGSASNPGGGAGNGSGGGIGQQRDPGAGVGARGDMGPPDDVLRVFLQNDGKLVGPVWQREQTDGLDAPSVPLVRQLRTAVEKAYPQKKP